MVTNPQYFIGLLLHIIGLVVFFCGQLYILTKVKWSKDPNVQSSIVKRLPRLFKITNWGLLISFSGGVLSLIALNEPDFFGLPKTWGWIMLAKLLLYMMLSISSIIIVEKNVPDVIASATVWEKSSDQSFKAIKNLKRILKVNLMVSLLIVVLGVVAFLL